MIEEGGGVDTTHFDYAGICRFVMDPTRRPDHANDAAGGMTTGMPVDCSDMALTAALRQTQLQLYRIRAELEQSRRMWHRETALLRRAFLLGFALQTGTTLALLGAILTLARRWGGLVP